MAAESGTEFRQVTVVDAHGTTAVHNGSQTLGTFGNAQGAACVAAGNMLDNPGVPDAVVEAFVASSGELETRLMAALRAGLDAGGEAGPVKSAGLSVTSGHGWRDTDLRVDWEEDPIGRLAELLDVWLPQRDDYVVRALTPDASIGYGVPGDDR